MGVVGRWVTASLSTAGGCFAAANWACTPARLACRLVHDYTLRLRGPAFPSEQRVQDPATRRELNTFRVSEGGPK
jgi:hypothetical protein